jgi:hypothetical protein
MAEAIYWGGQTEAYLSRFQKNQGKTNHCGAYSVAVAVSLLRGGQRLDYDQVVACADQHALLQVPSLAGLRDALTGRSLRLWKGGPMTPHQQARLARYIAAQHGLKVEANVRRGTPADLISALRQPDTVVLVTVGWNDRTRPEIVGPKGAVWRFAAVDSLSVGKIRIKYPFGAHVMVLAAYDPSRSFKKGEESITTPWGFINSWVDGPDPDSPADGELFWMTDAHFRRAWEYPILIGSRYMVTVRRVR